MKELNYAQRVLRKRRQLGKKSWGLIDVFEVWVGVLHFVFKRNILLPTDLAKLHRAIHTVCCNPAYKPLIDGWSTAFEQRIFGVYCQGIDDAMVNLSMADMISEVSDDYYIALPKFNAYWRNIFGDEMFTSEELELLDRMAYDLGKNLKH